VGLELLTGALGGAVGAAPGVLALLWSRGCHDETCSRLGTLGGGLLLLAGGTLGMAGGIKLGGDFLAGHGHFEIVYACEALTLLNVAAAGNDPSFKEHPVVAATSVFAITLVMGIVGYEIAHGHPSPADGKLSRSGGWMLPVVGVSPGGTLTGGLAGTF
jgi:hypothetical protein